MTTTRHRNRRTALHDLDDGATEDLVRDGVGVAFVGLLRSFVPLHQVHFVQACEDGLLYSRYM
jgi:hypothetical protein